MVALDSFITSFRTQFAKNLGIAFARTGVLKVTVLQSRRLSLAGDDSDDPTPSLGLAQTNGDGAEAELWGRQLTVQPVLGHDVPAPTGTVLYVQVEVRIRNGDRSSGRINTEGLNVIDVVGNVDPDALFLADPYVKLDHIVKYNRTGRTWTGCHRQCCWPPFEIIYDFCIAELCTGLPFILCCYFSRRRMWKRRLRAG